MNIQRVWRERSSLSQDLPGGSVLRFISRRHDRIDAHFKWGAKIVIFCFHASYLKQIYGVCRFFGFS